MFKLSGEKLYLFSGIASAASRISFSTAPISRSMAEAIVGAAAVLVSCPQATTVRIGTANDKTIGICFMTNSYLPKRKHWVYFRCAPRRQVAGQHGDRKQKQRHGQKHCRIVGANTVEQARHD